MVGLALFSDSAAVDGGDLAIGGVSAGELAAEFGTPLLVYCEATIRARARSYREAAPDALVVYGTKAFPNVAVMRLLAEEGLGADVSTLGELRFAQAAGVPPERLVVAPDCGMKYLPRDRAFRKLEAMVAGARLAEEALVA